MTDAASTAALAEEVGRRHGRVDAVVLAAGVTRWRPFEAVDQAQHWTAVGEGLTRLPTGSEVSGSLARLLADDAASGVVVVDEAAALRVPAQVQ